VEPEPLPTPANTSELHEILEPGHTFGSVTDKIASIVLRRRTKRGWIVGFLIGLSLVMLLNLAVCYLLAIGVGIWGIRIPVAWGFAIVNFVWWIGIGHAGTLISAICFCCARNGAHPLTVSRKRMTLLRWPARACSRSCIWGARGWPIGCFLIFRTTWARGRNFGSPLVWDVSPFRLMPRSRCCSGLWDCPDLATLREPRQDPRQESDLRHPLPWLAWIGGALGAL